MGFASCTKEKYGVIFHKNMDLYKIVNTWNNQVSQEVKDNYPDLDAEISGASAVIITQQGIHSGTTTAIEAYDDIAQLTENAAAILTGNPTLPATLAVSNLAKVADNAQVPILDSTQESIITNMDCG